MGDCFHSRHDSSTAAASSASSVPSAAPRTPSPAPGSVNIHHCRVGKISSALHTTSIRHMPPITIPGVFRSPVACSIPADRLYSWIRGKVSAAMKK